LCIIAQLHRTSVPQALMLANIGTRLFINAVRMKDGIQYHFHSSKRRFL
jgi:hypothetical protein